jgi:hypothetical protein
LLLCGTYTSIAAGQQQRDAENRPSPQNAGPQLDANLSQLQSDLRTLNQRLKEALETAEESFGESATEPPRYSVRRVPATDDAEDLSLGEAFDATGDRLTRFYESRHQSYLDQILRLAGIPDPAWSGCDASASTWQQARHDWLTDYQRLMEGHRQKTEQIRSRQASLTRQIVHLPDRWDLETIAERSQLSQAYESLWIDLRDEYRRVIGRLGDEVARLQASAVVSVEDGGGEALSRLSLVLVDQADTLREELSVCFETAVFELQDCADDVILAADRQWDTEPGDPKIVNALRREFVRLSHAILSVRDNQWDFQIEILESVRHKLQRLIVSQPEPASAEPLAREHRLRVESKLSRAATKASEIRRQYARDLSRVTDRIVPWLVEPIDPSDRQRWTSRVEDYRRRLRDLRSDTGLEPAA